MIARLSDQTFVQQMASPKSGQEPLSCQRQQTKLPLLRSGLNSPDSTSQPSESFARAVASEKREELLASFSMELTASWPKIFCQVCRLVVRVRPVDPTDSL